jgi:hypothetical protein
MPKAIIVPQCKTCEEAIVAKSTLTKAPVPSKTPAIYAGTIRPAGRPTGIITRMPAPADEVRLIVLNSLGEAVSETVRPVLPAEQGAVALDYGPEWRDEAGNAIYFLLVQGFLKGTLVWEQRLGRTRFHS